MSASPLSRRRALGLLGVGACTACGLAACGPDRGSDGTRSGAPVSASGDAVPLASVPENTTTLVDFGGQQPYVAIVRGAGDDVRGLSGYCTHQGCALSVAGEELDCPCHGSAFDGTSGDVLHGPATEPLAAVELTVDGDSIRRVR